MVMLRVKVMNQYSLGICVLLYTLSSHRDVYKTYVLTYSINLVNLLKIYMLVITMTFMFLHLNSYYHYIKGVAAVIL